jgi:hypothetical protein
MLTSGNIIFCHVAASNRDSALVVPAAAGAFLVPVLDFTEKGFKACAFSKRSRPPTIHLPTPIIHHLFDSRLYHSKSSRLCTCVL